MAQPRQDSADGAGTHPLWFIPPAGQELQRRVLTRERVVAEALAVIAERGVDALSMRPLATRLDVVPGALYTPCAQQGATARSRARRGAGRGRHPDRGAADLDRADHGARAPAARGPGAASRHNGAAQDPRPARTAPPRPGRGVPAPLHEAGLPPRQAGLAYSLVYGFTPGFALDGPGSVNEQRVRDGATRAELHAFLHSLPSDRFPTLVALSGHVWVDNRDEGFTTALDTILHGLETTLPSLGDGATARPNRR